MSICLGSSPWLWRRERPQTHLFPFDACGSHWPWWPLCDKKPSVMPWSMLGHCLWAVISLTMGSISHLVLLPGLLPSRAHLPNSRLALPPRNHPEGKAEQIGSKWEGIKELANPKPQTIKVGCLGPPDYPSFPGWGN